MIQFFANNVGSAVVTPAAGTDDSVRLVKGYGGPDDSAFVVQDIVNNRIFVKKVGTTDLVNAANVSGTVVNLVALLDGTYLFVNNLDGDVVLYKIDREGVIPVDPKNLFSQESGIGTQVHSLVVLPDDSFVIVSTKLNLVAPFQLIVEARRFDKNGELISGPAIVLERDIVAFSSYTDFAIRTRSRANSFDFVIALGIPSLDDPQILGVTFDASAMVSIGSSVISETTGVIYESFDDAVASNGLWMFHEGSVGNHVSRVIHPSKSGYRDRFDPVEGSRPTTELLPGPRNNVVDLDTGVVYAPGTTSVVTGIRQTFIFTFDRQNIVATPSLFHVLNTTFLRASAGTPSDFLVLVSGGPVLILMRVTTEDIPLAASPSDMGDKIQLSGTLVSSFLGLAESNILAINSSSSGELFVLHKVVNATEESLRIIRRRSDGIISNFTIDSGVIVGVKRKATALLLGPLGEVLVTYFKDDSNSVYVARLNSDATDFVFVPVNVVLATFGKVVDQVSTLLLDDLSFIVAYDERTSELSSSPKKVVVRKFDANGNELQSSTLYSQTGILAGSLRAVTRGRQSDRYFLVVITYSLSSSTVPVLAFAVDSENIIDFSFQGLAPGVGSLTNENFVSVSDEIRKTGLWISRMTPSEETNLMSIQNATPQKAGPFSASLLSDLVVFDVLGNMYAPVGSTEIKRQDRETRDTAVVAGFADFNFIPFVTGSGNDFYALSVSGNAVDVVQITRTDVPLPSENAIVSRVSEILVSPVSPGSPIVGSMEFLSIAKNVFDDVAVCRYEASTRIYHGPSRLFLDIYDKNLDFKSSVQLVDVADAPIIYRDDHVDPVNRNRTPDVLALYSGNFLVYWAEKNSDGSGRFKAAIVDPVGNVVKEFLLTPEAGYFWATRITVLPDDRFVASFIEWNPGDDSSSVFIQLFNSLGVASDLVTVAVGGRLLFEKCLIAPEYAHDSLLLVFSLGTEEVNPAYFVSKISIDNLANSEVAPLQHKGSLTPKRLIGYGGEAKDSVWIGESDGTQDQAFYLVVPGNDEVYSVEREFFGEYSIPSLSRPVFDIDGNVYGIRVGVPPVIRRLTDRPEYVGELSQFSVKFLTGTNFDHACICGTAERMIVPVYRAEGVRNQYDFLILTILGDRDQAAPITAFFPTIDSWYLDSGIVGDPYSFTLFPSTVAWSAEGLPDGLSITAGGFISGTPTEEGLFSVRISASNSSGRLTKVFGLKIKACRLDVGLVELSGPTNSAPLLSSGQSVKSPHVWGSSNTQFWSSHTVTSGGKEGVILQRHDPSGNPVGSPTSVQIPVVVTESSWESSIGVDERGRAVTIVGGSSINTGVSVHGPIYWSKYNTAGVILSSPVDVSGSTFASPRLHPRIFVFADSVSSAIWFEFDQLKATIISAVGVPVPPVLVAGELNPAIPAVITGTKTGTLFDVIYSDGDGLGFARYNKFGNNISTVSDIKNDGERIVAIDAVHSPFDGLITVLLSVVVGNNKRVVLQRFNSDGSSASKRVLTPYSEYAEFGISAKSLIELSDGSFLVTYLRNSDLSYVLKRYDRDLNQLGGDFVKTGIFGPNILSLTQVGESILWGYHSVPDLTIYRYKVDCDIEQPRLPPNASPTFGPTPCRTI